MRYINTFSDGVQVKDIYLVRKLSILQTKANRQLRDSEETAEERTRG